MSRKCRISIISTAVVTLICICIAIGCLMSDENRENNTTIVSVPIEGVADKIHNKQDYYITVVLEDSVIQSYNLSYDKISFQTKKSIYDRVFLDDTFIGLSVKITVSEEQSNADLGLVLKMNNIELCEIVSLTKSDNSVIDGM